MKHQRPLFLSHTHFFSVSMFGCGGGEMEYNGNLDSPDWNSRHCKLRAEMKCPVLILTYAVNCLLRSRPMDAWRSHFNWKGEEDKNEREKESEGYKMETKHIKNNRHHKISEKPDPEYCKCEKKSLSNGPFWSRNLPHRWTKMRMSVYLPSSSLTTPNHQPMRIPLFTIGSSPHHAVSHSIFIVIIDVFAASMC